MGDTGKKKAPLPSEVIESFSVWLDDIAKEYKAADAARKLEDSKLQDLLHDVEFAKTKEEKSRADAALRASRCERRKQKNRLLELEFVYNFFMEGNNRKTMNSLKQLLGNQRKREEYLQGERHYHYRVIEREEKKDGTN